MESNEATGHAYAVVTEAREMMARGEITVAEMIQRIALDTQIHPMGQVNAGYTITAAVPMGQGEYIVVGSRVVPDREVTEWNAKPGTDYVTWHAYAGGNAVTGGWLYEAGAYYPASFPEAYRHALRSMAERAGMAQPTEAYAVSAQVITHDESGEWSGSRQVPTFYLLPDVQGITSTQQARSVAESIISHDGETEVYASTHLVTLMGNTQPARVS